MNITSKFDFVVSQVSYEAAHAHINGLVHTTTEFLNFFLIS